MAKSGFDAEEPLDAGFLFSPLFWRSDKPWKPTPGQCRARVHDSGRSVTSHQCRRKAKVTRTVKHHGEVVAVEYCGLHDPVAVKAKRDAKRAKWKAEREARDAAAAEKTRQTDLRNDALDALKQIATGHNDPRTLALETLAKHGEPQ